MTPPETTETTQPTKTPGSTVVDRHRRWRTAAVVCWVVVVAGPFLGLQGTEVRVWMAVLVTAVGCTAVFWSRRLGSARAAAVRCPRPYCSDVV